MNESMPRYILKERSEQKLSMRCISTNLARPSRAFVKVVTRSRSLMLRPHEVSTTSR